MEFYLKHVLKVWCLGTVINIALYFPQQLYERYAISKDKARYKHRAGPTPFPDLRSNNTRNPSLSPVDAQQQCVLLSKKKAASDNEW